MRNELLYVITMALERGRSKSSVKWSHSYVVMSDLTQAKTYTIEYLKPVLWSCGLRHLSCSADIDSWEYWLRSVTFECLLSASCRDVLQLKILSSMIDFSYFLIQACRPRAKSLFGILLSFRWILPNKWLTHRVTEYVTQLHFRTFPFPLFLKSETPKEWHFRERGYSSYE